GAVELVVDVDGAGDGGDGAARDHELADDRAVVAEVEVALAVADEAVRGGDARGGAEAVEGAGAGGDADVGEDAGGKDGDGGGGGLAGVDGAGGDDVVGAGHGRGGVVAHGVD